MAYLDRWKTIFPETVGSETRPSNPIDNSLAFNTDGFPQFIANDPVRYDLQNAFLTQLFSNDARLGEMIDALDDALDNHKADTGAHAAGIVGNAGSATKLKTARSLQTDLASSQAASFDGTEDVTPGVTGILPVANGGTGQNTLSAVTVGKASQLENARKIDGVSFSGAGDIIHYGTCSTAAATVAKIVSCNNFTLTTGSIVFVKFTVTNTAASPTLNVNNTGAKAIQYRGSAIAAGYLAENRTYAFVYDGTNYQLIGDIDSDTHWTTHLYAGSGTAANESTANGNTKITVTDNSTVRNSITIKGTGATTVVSDANGNITIDSTDNNTTYSANNGVGLSGTTFYNSGVRSIATGSTNGTISVNTNGTATNVAVKGLGSAAYTASTAYTPIAKSKGGTQRPVYTDANGNIQACTATGSNGGLEGVNTITYSYIRYNSGLQICWFGDTISSTEKTVTFPASFIAATSTYSGAYVVGVPRARVALRVDSKTTTNFKAQTDSSTGYHVDFIAIGRWK